MERAEWEGLTHGMQEGVKKCQPGSPMVRTWGSILVWEPRSHKPHGAAPPKKKKKTTNLPMVRTTRQNQS